MSVGCLFNVDIAPYRCYLWLNDTLYFLYLSQLLQLWEKNGYFDEVTIQQLQSPAVGLGQYQVRTEASGLVKCNNASRLTI